MSVNATLAPRTGYGLMPFASLLEAYENVAECKSPVLLIQRELNGFVPHLVDDDGNVIEDHPYSWMTTSPDRKVPFGVWLTRFIKSTKVYDAPAVYLQRDNKGINALHYIDGSTLFVIVDQFGNTPEPEPIADYVRRMAGQGMLLDTNPIAGGSAGGNSSLTDFVSNYTARQNRGQSVPTKIPAYTQVIKGTPFSWWSSDDVWYMPQSRRMNAPYGESFIEMAWSWIMIIVNVTAFELGHYRTGNMPEGFVTVPRDLFGTTDAILAAEMLLNQRMTSNPATERNRVRVFPDGSKYFATKKPDFPEQLYVQAWKNILNAIGIPASEFGEIPGAGLGGKGFKEGASSDFGRRTLNPHRDFVASLFNKVLEEDNVDNAHFVLDYALEEIDPDKKRASIYEGMAHGTLSLNDALGELNLNPVGDPNDKDNVANKHLIVAGASIFVVEDMETQNGMAVPLNAPAPGGASGGQPVTPDTAVEQDGKEHDPKQDAKTLQTAIKNMIATGTLDGKFMSVPSGNKFAKFNPNHDDDGRFGEGSSTPNSNTSGYKNLGAKTHDEINQYSAPIAEKQDAKLGWAQKGSLATYSETKPSEEINAGLRKGEIPEKYKDDIDRIDKAIDKSKIPESVVVYKGVRNAPDNGFPIGAEINSKPYLSTSLSREVAGTFTTNTNNGQFNIGKSLLEIEAPKGTKGVYMDNLSEVGNEHELLLPRGTKMKVTGKREEDGYIIHTVSIVNG